MITDASKGLSFIALLTIVITILVLAAFLVFMITGDNYVSDMAIVIGNLATVKTP